MWRALYGYSGDPDDASDAVAEAFAQALRRGDEIRALERWVWKAAFRIAAGELKRRRAAAEGVIERSHGAPESVADLVSALRRLPEKQRGAVVLHHYADYPVREVAAILGSTPAAVRVHLSRGRRTLRKLLEERDE